MAFVPFPGLAEIALHRKAFGQDVVTVFHYASATIANYTAANLTDLATEIGGRWVTSLQPLSVSAYTGNKIVARALDSQTAPSIEIGFTSTGTWSAGTALPASVCLAIKKSTGLRGRSYRGRWFYSGWGHNSVVGNAFVPTDVNSVLTAHNTFLTVTAGGHVHTLMVASRWENGIQRTTGVATQVVELTADTSVDSQRRRLTGRGS